MLDRKIHSSWKSFLTPEVIFMINECAKKLVNEDYFPDRSNILRFLEVDKENIKVVIVGMEPYPSSYIIDDKEYPIATGRSFEIANITDWREKYKQSSMRNILKCIYYNQTGVKPTMDELRNSITDGSFPILQPKEWFDKMQDQGVLFLNATLTVKRGQAGTKLHEDIWADFVTLLIKELEKQNPEWMLWGNTAQERVLPFVQNAICSCHPRLDKFIYDNSFGRSKTGINWVG